MNTINIFWFRRDLRLYDNAALYHALKDKNPVIPIFIFDKNILDKLENKEDKRVTFIYEAVKKVQEELKEIHSSLEIYYDLPENTFQKILTKYKIEKVFTNHDYEPYAIERDNKVNEILKNSGAALLTFKDHVIFEKNEILKNDGKPYTVFTPYSRKWKEKINDFYVRAYPTKKYFSNFYKHKGHQFPSLESMGFKQAGIIFPGNFIEETIIQNYYEKRNFPIENGTTRLGVHLRFGKRRHVSHGAGQPGLRPLPLVRTGESWL